MDGRPEASAQASAAHNLWSYKATNLHRGTAKTWDVPKVMELESLGASLILTSFY